MANRHQSRTCVMQSLYELDLRATGKIEEIIKRTAGVLLEDISSKFDVFGEALDYVRQKVDKLEEKITKLEEKITKLEEKITNIEIDIASIKNELIEIKERLNEKVDRYEYLELKKRVDKLEYYIKRYIVRKTPVAV